MKNWRVWLSLVVVFYALPAFTALSPLLNTQSDFLVYLGFFGIILLFVAVVRALYVLGQAAYAKLSTLG